MFSFIGILPLPTSRHSFSSINDFDQVSIHSVFACFFIGLEILGIALYVLIAYPRRRVDSLEAGIKYLVLAAASAAFLLFGMALIYMDTGSLAFARMTFLTGALTATGARPLMLAGAAMLVAFLAGGPMAVPAIGLSGGLVLAAAAVLLVWLGIRPGVADGDGSADGKIIACDLPAALHSSARHLL